MALNQSQHRHNAPGLDNNMGSGAPSVAEAAAESLKSEIAGQLPDAVIPDYLGYTRALAVHLADKFQRPVTFQSLIEAKMSALEFCISEKWAERLTRACLKASGTDEGPFARMVESALQKMTSLVGRMGRIAEDVPAFLRKSGISEQEIMDQVGLNAANLQKCRDGTLTLGELFMTQPSVIIKNTD